MVAEMEGAMAEAGETEMDVVDGRGRLMERGWDR